MRGVQYKFLLGLWLLLVPFLGIPGSWKERLVALTGLFLLLSAFFVYYRKGV